MQHVSAEGRKALTASEGRELVAYRDERGIWTVGVGHTGRMSGIAVHAGMTITEAECDAMLAADLAPVEDTIAKVVTVPLSQNEFDALASLGFNIGVGGLARSTVVKRINLGDIEGAAAAFMDWCKPASLTARRVAERQMFLRTDSHEVGTAREAALVHKASLAKSNAKRTGAGAAVTAVAGASVVVGASVAHHGHVALAFATIVAVGVIIDGLVVFGRLSTATTLAANASKQTPAIIPIPAVIAAIDPPKPAAAVPASILKA